MEKAGKLNMFAVFLLNRWRGMGHGPLVALVEIFMGQDRHVASEARLSGGESFSSQAAVPWTVGFRVRAVIRARGRPGWKRNGPHCLEKYFLPDATLLSQQSRQKAPLRNAYPYVLSAPTSEGLNVSPEAKQPFQEMEFDS